MSKDGIDVGAGVIDPDYRGEVKTLLINNSSDEVKIQKNDRVAQLILEKASIPIIKEVKELGKTERGEKGFGSTNNVQLSNNDNKKDTKDIFSVYYDEKRVKILLLKGDIAGNPVEALVDSGAGDNYISMELAQHLRKYRRDKKKTQVQLADGKLYNIVQKLVNVPITFNGWKTLITFDILPLQGHQVILGKSWLYQNNPSIDWKTNEISIQDQGKNIIIKNPDF